MNRTNLRAAFDREGVRPSAYDLDPGRLEERYCLRIVSTGRAVYYMERGRRVDEVVFETEDEACSELLMRVTSDPTTRTK